LGKIDPSTEEMTFYRVGFYPTILSLDSSGNVWFTDILEGNLHRFNITSEELVTISGFDRPLGLCAYGSFVFVAENSQPFVEDPDYQLDKNGTVAIYNIETGEIQRVNTTIITTEGPNGVHVDLYDNVWFGDNSGHMGKLGHIVDNNFIADVEVCYGHGFFMTDVVNGTEVQVWFSYGGITIVKTEPFIDSDGDGLADEEEASGWDIIFYSCSGEPQNSSHVTSDPNIADEDGDGLNDYEEKEGWHVSYVLNDTTIEYDVSSHPRVADDDNDGKNDLEEKIAGTDPNRADTDCDGAWDTNDGFEIDHGMNPLNSDTDNDGITDGEEIDMWIEAAGYDPKQPELVPSSVLAYAITGTCSPMIPATINIDPDTLNLKSNGEWITAYIELPESYNVEDIGISTVMLNNTVSVDLDAPTQIGDYDLDGMADLMVKFDRASIIEWLGTMDYSEDTGKSYFEILTITGTVLDMPFEGSDTIKVLHK